MPKQYNALFRCTGNSARSILAEAILNHRGTASFKGYSAGSHPRGQVNPYALKILESAGLSTDQLRSRNRPVVVPAPR